MEIDPIQIITFIISALLIPAIVSWYSSDLRVAQLQKKRDHYLELVKSLDDWRNILYLYAPITIPNPSTDEFTQPEPKQLSELPYHLQFMDHMKSGYTDLWEKWEKLSSGIANHTNNHVQLLNDIASEIKQIAESNGVNAIFPYSMKTRPRYYLNLGKMATTAFSEIQYRLEGYPAWNNTRPHYKDKSVNPDGSEYHSWESWGETILIHDDVDVAERVIKGYITLVDSGVFDERVDQILADRDEWGKKSNHLQSLIEQEAEKVRLGENMKGKCMVCRKFDII